MARVHRYRGPPSLSGAPAQVVLVVVFPVCHNGVVGLACVSDWHVGTAKSEGSVLSGLLVLAEYLLATRRLLIQFTPPYRLCWGAWVCIRALFDTGWKRGRCVAIQPHAAAKHYRAPTRPSRLAVPVDGWCWFGSALFAL